MKAFIRLWQILSIDRKEISSVYLYAIISGLIQLTLPLGIQSIIGFVMGATMVTSVYVLILLVVAGVLFVGILQMNQMKIIEKIQQNFFARYSFEFAELIPALDLKKADQLYLPEHINKFFETVTIQKGISKILLDFPIAVIQILFGLLLLSAYNSIFIIFGLLLVLVLAGIFRLTANRGMETSLKESTYKYKLAGWLQEMASIIKSFKFTQGTHFNLTQTDEYMSGYLKARTSHFRILLFQYRSLVFFKVIITAAMLIIGSYLLIEQQLNIGEFISAEIVILMIITAIEKIIGSLDSVYDIVTGVEKLKSVTDSPVEQSGILQLDTAGGPDIKVRHLSFSYVFGQRILDDISLTACANEITCISGAEGSGKSTLLKILGNCYNDFEGALLVDQIPVQNYKLESLRKHTGIYLSQPEIFNGTVLDNIIMNREGITAKSVIGLASELGFEDFVTHLSKGLNTRLQSGGHNLSYGLIKKILLLRALCHKPKIILLDEPFVRLDVEIKQNLIAYLNKQKKNSTIIVFTNDEIFAQQCDQHFQLPDKKTE